MAAEKPGSISKAAAPRQLPCRSAATRWPVGAAWCREVVQPQPPALSSSSSTVAIRVEVLLCRFLSAAGTRTGNSDSSHHRSSSALVPVLIQLTFDISMLTFDISMQCGARVKDFDAVG